MASFPIFALTQNNPDLDAAAPLVGLFFFIYFALIILVIVSMWKIFAKAGKPGWAAIIPIYNIIVLFEIIGKPAWWVVLLIVFMAHAVVCVQVWASLSARPPRSSVHC